MKRYVGSTVAAIALLGVTVTYQACTQFGFQVADPLLVNDLQSSSTNPPGGGGGTGVSDLAQGKALYANNCAACHNALDISPKRDRTLEQIKSAMEGIPTMTYLKGRMTDEQLRLISLALKSNGVVDGTACTPSSLGRTPLRRLTRTELQYSLIDLVGLNQNFTAQVDVDAPGASGFSNDAKVLTIGANQLGKVMTAIENAVKAGVSAQNSILLRCTNNVQDVNCARTQLSAFARKAYRRNPTATELNALVGVYTAHQSSGFAVAMQTAYQRALLSPNFMYVTSFSGGSTAKGKSLTNQEFAGRLALMLWNSVPDAALMDVADNGTLRQETVLKAQIARMLRDTKALRFSDTMFKEWFGYDKVADSSIVIRDGLTAQMRTDMANETAIFLNSLIQEDKSLAQLVTADYTYVNASLAAHYGIGGVTSTNFQKVSLVNTGRRGIASHGSILASLSNTDDSRPVVRGFFMLDKILCQTPPPPPGDVDTGAFDNIDQTKLTIREVMAIHRANPTCASCHSLMDPLGLSLENFNQTGKSRNVYNGGRSVDASGDFLGKPFRNYEDLSGLLGQQSSVRACLASHVLSYAIHRKSESDEKCMANKIAAAAIKDSSKLSDLVYSIVTNDMFNYNVSDSN